MKKVKSKKQKAKLAKRPLGHQKKRQAPGLAGASSLQNMLQQALSLHQCGRLAEAEALYRQILQVDPYHPDALHYLGMLAHQMGRSEIAVELIDQALSYNSRSVEAYNNLGIIFQSLGQSDKAEINFLRALALKPDFAEVHYNLGNALKDQGRLDDAIASLHRALAIKPNYIDALSNLGVILKDQGKPAEAIDCFHRALALKPDYLQALNNLGNTLKEVGKLEEAITIYRQALALKPDYVETLNNLGIALGAQGKQEEAIASYRKALTLKPDYSEAHNNLGHALVLQGNLNEAIASYHRALALKPDYLTAHSNLLFCLNYLPGQSISDYLDEARHYGTKTAAKVSEQFLDWTCTANPKQLCIGLVSGDFRKHPVGYFLENLLAHLDPKQIKLTAYLTHHCDDALTARIRSRFIDWKPLMGMEDERAARLIRSDGIHILVDLAGHSSHNRLPVFAWKPAPIQATWLGYSASTGLAEMDYLIADPYVVPPEEEAHFTEKVWRLPESYLCFSPPHAPIPEGPLPALREGLFTFGSFNNPAKMNDAVVALWAKVLHAVPNSRLFLKAKQFFDPSLCETTRQRFAAFGITPHRLLLEGPVPRREEHLAAYNRVDVALDPFPYNGTTTSIEGLWMGVPFLSLRGDRFISHVGESIACNIGMADWVAIDEDDYVAKATAQAADLEKLAGLRASLRQQILSSPLFDGKRFARNFEAALWGMWRKRDRRL